MSNADDPRRGESLPRYLRRVGPAPSAPRSPPPPPSPFPRFDPNTLARESWRRGSLQPTRRPRTRTHQDLPSFLREGQQAEAEYRGPTSMNVREIPQALNPALGNPRRGVGLIQWGADGRRPVRDILADVETVTGAPRGLLSAIGYRESAGDTRAKNPDSSAQGPFQFVKDTWLQWGRGALPLYGMASTMDETELLWQREDWAMSGAATTELARYNHGELSRIGKSEASFADLYMMHFSYNSLGLIRDLQGGRTRALASDYYSAAEIAANPPLRLGLGPQQFYDHMTRLGRSDALSREPVRFGPRLDGTTARFVPDRAGALHLEE